MAMCFTVCEKCGLSFPHVLLDVCPKCGSPQVWHDRENDDNENVDCYAYDSQDDSETEEA